MKKLSIALLASVIFFSTDVFSQNTTDSTQQEPLSADSVQAYSSTTGADSSANTNHQTFPAPNFGRYYIPVLGAYTSAADASAESSSENKNVTIAGDESNPGKIWIEGLVDQKIYALRKPGSGLYKIPAQKSGDNNIAEGTLAYDDSSNEVNICLGCKYKDESPLEVFEEEARTKTAKNSKASKIVSFKGSKAEGGTASASL